MNDLPLPARRYLERIGELSGEPLAIIGTGAAREATIMIRNPFLC
jgi:adenylosuccinate synthase